MQASFTTLRLQHDLQIQYTAECEQKKLSYLLSAHSEAPRSDGTVEEDLRLFLIQVCPFGFSEDTEKKNSQITDQSTTDLFSSEQMQTTHFLC